MKVGTVFLCILLLGGAWTDLKYRRVKNSWLLWGMAAGIWVYRWMFLIPAGGAVLVVFLLFRLGLVSAGDGKLMACIIGYLGWNDGFAAVGLGLMVGAVWSLYILWNHESLRARLLYLFAWIGQCIQTKTWMMYLPPKEVAGEEEIPLAVCLAAGTYLYLLLEGCRMVVGR